jgi:hypothetical protein
MASATGRCCRRPVLRRGAMRGVGSVPGTRRPGTDTRRHRRETKTCVSLGRVLGPFALSRVFLRHRRADAVAVEAACRCCCVDAACRRCCRGCGVPTLLRGRYPGWRCPVEEHRRPGVWDHERSGACLQANRVKASYARPDPRPLGRQGSAAVIVPEYRLTGPLPWVDHHRKAGRAARIAERVWVRGALLHEIRITLGVVSVFYRSSSNTCGY